MTNKIRIIPRLDIKGPNVVKGIQLEGLRVVGNPSELARKYYNEGADELIYIDIVASLYDRNNLAHIVEETTKNGVFIPITVGGGLRSLSDIGKMLRSGADKVAINTAAVKNPNLIKEAAMAFGSSTIVLSVEAKKISEGNWEVYIENGRQKTQLDVIEWIKQGIELGAGEILITSVDKDGTKSGYDMDLINAVALISKVPVVVSGGAGSLEDVSQCMLNKNINGISLATLLHYGELNINDIKSVLKQRFNNRVRHEIKKENYVLDKRIDVEVSIIDYNLSNLHSVRNAFRQIGAEAKFINNPEDVLNAKCLVLPGVGTFEEGMKNLTTKGLDDAIRKYVRMGKPLLGICLGMELLLTKSYEFGEHDGLGIIEGEVLPFRKEDFSCEDYKIPHVGWNTISMDTNCKGSIFDLGLNNIDAYFVHSLYVKPDNLSDVYGSTDYFGKKFASVIQRGNIFGCQFHPEKSGNIGLKILGNFCKKG
ncbi:MAG: imidazole glycerol phosphate synthase subunit HisF [Candidatus Omnitrophica bacterium]|nr:imidazole glycerol phosphate synthase subunit HisF [Candidatus Omnitrophota bacterium]